MSIGPNKVMNGNCEPPSGRTSIRSSRPVAQFPPLYPILSALAPFYIRHEPSPLIDFKSFNRIPAQGLDNHSRRGVPRVTSHRQQFPSTAFFPLLLLWLNSKNHPISCPRPPIDIPRLSLSLPSPPFFSTISNTRQLPHLLDKTGRGRDLVPKLAT